MLRRINATLVLIGVLFSANARMISASNLEKENGLIYLKNDKYPFTGKAIYYYPNGKKKESYSL